MTTGRFRKLPVEVEAIRWTGDNIDEVAAFIKAHDPGNQVHHPPEVDRFGMRFGREVPPDRLYFGVRKGNSGAIIDPGGWVIAEPDGHGVYPCTAEDFDATYTRAPDVPVAIDRLYGEPEAEELFADPGEVIAHALGYEDPDPDDGPLLVQVEEWTVHPPRHHLPSAEMVRDWIAGWVDDGANSELSDPTPFDRVLGFHSGDGVDPDVEAAAEHLLDVIASKVTWRQADQLVARHAYRVRGTDDYELIRGDDG